MSRNKQKNKKKVKNTNTAKPPKASATGTATNVSVSKGSADKGSASQRSAGKAAQAGKSCWQSYGLDQIAQQLVLNALDVDSDSLNQSHKMRMSVAYGLERFWGEHLRLRNSKKAADKVKSDYWKATWDELVAVMKKAGVTIPNHSVAAGDVKEIQAMSEELWALDPSVQRVSLAVLTQLCDCIVWWTQRYKGVSS